MLTAQQKAAALLRIMVDVAQTIREAREVPAGVIYAALSTHGCTLDQFDALIGQLVSSGLVVRDYRANTIRWNAVE